MTPPFFQVLSKDPSSFARKASLCLERTSLDTPTFMPVGTLANVKGLWSEDLVDIGYKLILGNAYHLSLRPGLEVLSKFQSLRKFMKWPHAILTDSGGYQIYSLADCSRFHENGVEFQSHLDGSRHLYTPQKVVEIQRVLDSDISMVLDDCPPAHANKERLEASLSRTHLWAKQSLEAFLKYESKNRFLFGIAQGGLSEKDRLASLHTIQSMEIEGKRFDGIALGGLSVGEERDELYHILNFVAPHLDIARPHYLMGVGTILDILEGVRCGIDLFDCVWPTRNARNAQAITSKGALKLRNSAYAKDIEPLDIDCHCRVCAKGYSRSYIRHLFMAKEMLGPILLSYHNLYFYFYFMKEMRSSIKKGKFSEFYEKWHKIFAKE